MYKKLNNELAIAKTPMHVQIGGGGKVDRKDPIKGQRIMTDRQTGAEREWVMGRRGRDLLSVGGDLRDAVRGREAGTLRG